MQGSCYFNTSHVSINRWQQQGSRRRVSNFNTSHVSINPSCVRSYTHSIRISIHLMFLLIACALKHLCSQQADFNTSHVSINRRFDRSSMYRQMNFNTSHVSINPTLLSAFPFLLYLKFLENTSFFKFFPSVSQT